jgi:hypothetical protein
MPNQAVYRFRQKQQVAGTTLYQIGSGVFSAISRRHAGGGGAALEAFLPSQNDPLIARVQVITTRSQNDANPRSVRLQT